MKKDIDPIELADKIKKGMSKRFLNDMRILKRRRLKLRLVRQS